MSLLQFSNTTTKAGIIEQIAKRTNTQSASTTAYSLAEKTVDVNFALANFFIIANQCAGRFSPADDTNQIDYPIVYANIVAGQQDYSLTVDGSGNQILDIYKVRIKDINGNWTTLEQIDVMNEDDSFLNDTTTGTPTRYELTANGIFLNVIPDYSQADSLEIYVSRGSSYFVSTDTTKVAGIPEIFQEYLVLRPSYFYCLSKGLPQAAALGLELYGGNGRIGMEKAIRNYFSNRNRGEKRRMNTNANRAGYSNR